jgi:uncharacterized membrane protein
MVKYIYRNKCYQQYYSIEIYQLEICVNYKVKETIFNYVVFKININELRNKTRKEKNMPRKTRSDCTVGAFEKKAGLPKGTIRNNSGRDTRSDKRISTIRRERNK